MFNRIKKFFGITDDKSTSDSSLITTGGYYQETPPLLSIEKPKVTHYARELLKEATTLKKEKKYKEACEKLTEAYATEGAENLTIRQKLRLPMYLQLAGEADEGWRILNEMNITYSDIHSQVAIADQMTSFLNKEKNYKQALIHSLWHYCLEILRLKQHSFEIQQRINQLIEENQKIYGELSRLGVQDTNYNQGEDRGIQSLESHKASINQETQEKFSLETLRKHFGKLLKKLKREDILESLAVDFQAYLTSNQRYRFSEVRDIILRHLG